ncbi:MAG TPA: hypothetical protein DE117_01695 [Fervidobacterium sp.]|nr:hypothetical protein [Fervidobacterium sp.]
MRKMVFSLLLLSCSLNILGSPINKSVQINSSRLESIISDVSLLTLGSLGNLSLATEVGKYVGGVLKSRGYAYYVLGPLDTLSEDDDDYFYRVNKSPFITADVYDKLATGLTAAGIIPVFDGRGKIDTYLVSSLVSRKLTYPVIVEDEGKANLLRNMKYSATFIIEEEEGYIFLNAVPVSLYWMISISDASNIRKQVLLNSILFISEGEVQVRKPFSKSGVVVYSSDDFVIEEAKAIMKKKVGPGRIPW